MEDIMPYIQLFSKGKIIYNSLNDIKLSKYKPKDLNIIFHLNGVEVGNIKIKIIRSWMIY